MPVFPPVTERDHASLRFSCGKALISMPRSEGLALLDSMGFGRPEFGAVAARELAPRCRRRLWHVHSSAPPRTPVLTPETPETPEREERARAHARALLALCTTPGLAHTSAVVIFG